MLNELKPQEGVTFYLDEYDTCVDLDIDADVDVLSLTDKGGKTYRNISYCLRDVKKQFPNIKTIIIEKYISDIDISNLMFPNVSNVISKNEYFSSAPMLIRKYGGNIPSQHLQNTFCSSKDAVIDLAGIDKIDDFAFEGCLSTNIINYDGITLCQKDAFSGSLFMNSHVFYNNGIIRLGHILIDIDKTVKKVIFPKDITVVPSNIVLFTLDEIVFKDIASILHFACSKFPNTVTIDDDSNIPIIDLVRCTRNVQTKNFNFTDKNNLYCSVDGVIYTKDRKILITYPAGRKGRFSIPEGTEKIADNAFSSTRIETVKFPESLKWIGSSAFSNCKNLKFIEFNHTITDYSEFDSSYIFAGCVGLKTIDIPGNIKVLGEGMFNRCQPEKVILHNGLKVIKKEAFNFAYPVPEIEIPASLKLVKEYNFGTGNLDIIKAVNRTPKGFLAATITSELSYGGTYSDNLIITLIINEDGKDYTFYIPRYLEQRQITELDDFFSTFSPKYMTDEKMDSLYASCLNRILAQDTALRLYYLTGHECFKDALKNSRKSIVKRYFEDADENSLVKFFKFGFFAKSSLETYLKQAQKMEMTSLSAYLLKEIEKKAPKKGSTKFKI